MSFRYTMRMTCFIILEHGGLTPGPVPKRGPCAARPFQLVPAEDNFQFVYLNI